MAGYVRQSSYSIGDTILAAHSNNEFNQLVAAFHATTGHKHDGTAAEGPTIKILLDADADTGIEVERTADNDTIHIKTATVDRITVGSTGVITATSDAVFNGSVDMNGVITLDGATTFSVRPAFNGGTSGVDSPFTVDSTFVVTNLNADLLDGIEGTSFVRSDTADSVDGVLTYTAIPIFNGGTSGVSSPFTVDSTFVVTNLNADLLDGIEGTSFVRSDIPDDVVGALTFLDIPNFNGGTSGVSPPFNVDSTTKVTNLNADLLDGIEGANYARTDIQETFTTGILNSDGTAASPSYSFTSDPNTGMYSVSADVLGFSVGGAKVAEVTSSGIVADELESSGTAPRIYLNETDAAVDNKIWSIRASGEVLSFRTSDDDKFAESVWMSVHRTGTDVDSVNFGGAGNVLFNFGTAAAPTITFQSDTDTGIFRATTNRMGFTTAGVSRFALDTFEAEFSVPVVGPLGSITSPTFSFSSDPNTGIYSVSADVLGFSTGGVKALEINSSGIEISSTTPNIELLDTDSVVTEKSWSFRVVGDELRIDLNDDSGSFFNSIVRCKRTGTDPESVEIVPKIIADSDVEVSGNLIMFGGQTQASNGTASSPGYAFENDATSGMYLISAARLGFAANGVKTMEMDSSGIIIDNATPASDKTRFNHSGYVSGTVTHAEFQEAGVVRGSITSNGTNTAYNTSSDYRLKENVIDLGDALSRVKELKPRRFNFITSPDTTVDGFIAHEVQSLVPEAVTGEKDGEEMQQLDASKLIPLLTAAIKELEERISVLENSQ